MTRQILRAVMAMWFVSAPPIIRAQTPMPTVYSGMCDASGAAALDDHWFVVADDEDTRLRVYPAEGGGPPAQTIDVADFLKLDPKKPEIDLEAAARIGDTVFWISSHGRNRHGKARPSRLRFFATAVTNAGRGVTIQPVGRFYAGLLAELFRDPRLRPFRLEMAAKLPPKFPDGLNIEGLAATPERQLLIGFRNPIPRRKALVVPLENPFEVIAGQRPKLGAPLLLDLEGLGIRAMSAWHGGYLIVAGSADARGRSRFFEWAGGASKPVPMPNVNFLTLNPEAVVVYPERTRVQILSDDGTLKINGVDCKDLKDPQQKGFRALWVTP